MPDTRQGGKIGVSRTALPSAAEGVFFCAICSCLKIEPMLITRPRREQAKNESRCLGYVQLTLWKPKKILPGRTPIRCGKKRKKRALFRTVSNLYVYVTTLLRQYAIPNSIIYSWSDRKVATKCSRRPAYKVSPVRTRHYIQITAARICRHQWKPHDIIEYQRQEWGW